MENNFIYENDITGSYMIADSMGDDYRVHMLEYNKIPGLLDVSVSEDTEKTKLKYDISSKVTLKHILEVRPLTGKDVKNIMLAITAIIREIKYYLLDESDIILDTEYIYVKDDLKVPEFCYLPFYDHSFSESLSDLLGEILAAVDNNDHEGVVLAYSLYQASLKENYVIDDLIALL